MATCALCLATAELKDSHFLPAALYKAVAQGHAPYDDAPVMMDMTEGTAIQKNTQIRRPALCGECEQRFSRGGERPVIASCHRKDGAFVLRDRLKAQQPCVRRNGRAIYFGHNLPDVFAAPAFGYFTLSVIWRASAITWPGSTGVTPGCLGDDYQESFRRFLLGDADFPQNTAVNIHVYFDDEPTPFLAFPTHRRATLGPYRFHEHTLIIPGMTIKVWVGRGVSELEAMSGSKPGFPTFFETKFAGSNLQRRVAEDIKGLVPKGKLARSSE